jgi:hypothetical protein
VFNNAYLIQKDTIGTGYNQVKGQKLIGLFHNNELDSITIDKNVEVIFYMRNDEQELIGIDNTTSSSLEMYLESQQITGVKFIKKVPGKIYPPSKFPDNARLLPEFKWRGEERLFIKEDLFKGKPKPILTKIKGIPLPEDEGEFFDETPLEDIELPKDSKLKPKDLQNRKDDPKFKTRGKENEDG